MIKVILGRDGAMDVEIGLPEGAECDDTYAMFRTVLVALGVDDGSGSPVDRTTQVESEYSPERTRVRNG